MVPSDGQSISGDTNVQAANDDSLWWRSTTQNLLKLLMLTQALQLLLLQMTICWCATTLLNSLVTLELLLTLEHQWRT